MTAAHSVLVIGLGNEHRSDDGVGLRVARALRRRRLNGVHVVEHSGEASGLIELWRGVDRVFVIDATVSGAAPGTVYRVDLLQETLDERGFRSSSHTFGLVEAVRLGRALDALPGSLWAYGIEAGSLAYGQRLTRPVGQAVVQVCDRLGRVLEAGGEADGDDALAAPGALG